MGSAAAAPTVPCPPLPVTYDNTGNDERPDKLQAPVLAGVVNVYLRPKPPSEQYAGPSVLATYPAAAVIR